MYSFSLFFARGNCGNRSPSKLINSHMYAIGLSIKISPEKRHDQNTLKQIWNRMKKKKKKKMAIHLILSCWCTTLLVLHIFTYNSRSQVISMWAFFFSNFNIYKEAMPAKEHKPTHKKSDTSARLPDKRGSMKSESVSHICGCHILIGAGLAELRTETHRHRGWEKN